MIQVMIGAAKAAVVQYAKTSVVRAGHVVRDPLVQAKAASLAQEVGEAWRRNGGAARA